MDNIIYKTLPNGLTLCLVKKSGFVRKHAMLAFACGSVDTSFNGARVPDGTAHFLEHKLFEKKHGNIFDSFSALGADVNAFTGSDITAYYFFCCEGFEKCLSLLCKMACEPYFTDKGVEREKGIISSEITMYDDDPMWQAHFGMLGGLYGSHPAGVPVAGSRESIAEITADTLNLFYKSFYTADNAILVAAGDIDENSFFEQAEKELKLSEEKRVQTTLPESTGVDRVLVKKRMPLASPVFAIGFKEKDFDMSPLMRTITSKILAHIIAGSGSVLYEKLYTSLLCSSPLGLDYICGRGFGATVISGTSQNPERLLSLLHSEIKNYLDYGISDKNMQRIITKCRGRLMCSMDSPDFCCNLIADNFTKSIKTLDIFDKYDTINNSELLLRLERHFAEDNLCLCEVSPE